jgi:transcriptional regulator with XRE-family HTH domain
VNETIKRLRLKRHIKQVDLAKLVGISQNHLSQIEKGIRKVSLKLLDQFADAFGLVPADLLEEIRPMIGIEDTGEVIAWAREQRGMTVEELASAIDETPETLKKWEKNGNLIDSDKLYTIIDALNTTYDYLSGGTDDPRPVEEELSLKEVPPKRSRDEPAPRNGDRLDPRTIQAIHEMVSVPVFDLRTCAGNGSSHIFEDVEVLYELQLPAVWVGPVSIDDNRKPFLTKINGDSMSEAGLHDGALALVNPAADVHSGDAAMVAFGPDRETALKWVYYMPGGVIELRSATPGFPVYSFTRDQQMSEESPLIIIGKVMGEWSEPKRG